jgi:hypothetical protein
MSKTRVILTIVLFLQTGLSVLSAQSKAIRQPSVRDDHPQYFPSDFDGFERTWYHRQLAALKEPSLYEGRTNGKTLYRFLWIPSFHHTIAARLSIKDDGSGTLVLKEVSGAGGYDPGHLAIEKSVQVSAIRVREVVSLIDGMQFWKLGDGEINKEMVGDDGAQWVLEGAKAGDYRVVEMWSPRTGPLVELGNLLIKQIGGMNGKDILSY